jgi:hypothetical protein
MKNLIFVLMTGAFFSGCNNPRNMSRNTPAASDQMYIDVHYIGKGKVTVDDVAKAHQKDLMAEKKYGVDFLRYWVDEESGTIYCLSRAPGKREIIATHKEAHGLIPQEIHEVKSGQESSMDGNMKLYLDIHNLGKGKVTADAVAQAHKKDLMVQDKYHVSFKNYWVDEANGYVYCLSQSPGPESIVKTHKEAHGLVPQTVMEVTQGK